MNKCWELYKCHGLRPLLISLWIRKLRLRWWSDFLWVTRGALGDPGLEPGVLTMWPVFLLLCLTEGLSVWCSGEACMEGWVKRRGSAPNVTGQKPCSASQALWAHLTRWGEGAYPRSVRFVFCLFCFFSAYDLTLFRRWVKEALLWKQMHMVSNFASQLIVRIAYLKMNWTANTQIAFVIIIAFLFFKPSFAY